MNKIWPRYHQLEVVRKLLQDAASNGAGKAVPDSALGRERQVALHRVALPTAD